MSCDVNESTEQNRNEYQHKVCGIEIYVNAECTHASLHLRISLECGFRNDYYITTFTHTCIILDLCAPNSSQNIDSTAQQAQLTCWLLFLCLSFMVKPCIRQTPIGSIDYTYMVRVVCAFTTPPMLLRPRWMIHSDIFQVNLQFGFGICVQRRLQLPFYAQITIQFVAWYVNRIHPKTQLIYLALTLSVMHGKYATRSPSPFTIGLIMIRD